MEFYDFESYTNQDESEYENTDSVSEIEREGREDNGTFMDEYRNQKRQLDKELGDAAKDIAQEMMPNVIKTKIVDSFVNIDSRNRDIKTYPDPNNYEIELDREYTNVKEVRVVSSQIPNMNKNVFSDPLVLKNNSVYWQVFSDNCETIFDYRQLDEQKTLVYVDDMDPDVLNLLFLVQQTEDPSESPCDNDTQDFFLDKVSSARVANTENYNKFDLQFADILPPEQAAAYMEMYRKKYMTNNILKVLKNEAIDGYYNALTFMVNFTYWGPDVRDCTVLLGILCIRNTLNPIYTFGVKPSQARVFPCGYLQTMPVGVEHNNTFLTRNIEISSGLYDDNRLSSEMSIKMTDNTTVVRASINEFKSESRFRTFRKRPLGENALFCLRYDPISLISSGKKLQHVLIIKFMNHRLCDNDLVTYEKYSANVTFASQVDMMLRSSLYGKTFRVQTLKARTTGKTVNGYQVYGVDGLQDFYFTEPVVFPLSQNYFFVDLEQVYDKDFCRSLFANFSHSFGIERATSVVSTISPRRAISGLGDMVTKFEKMKMLMNAPYTMYKMLGFPPLDSTDHFAKKLIVQKENKISGDMQRFYFESTNHNLVHGDVISINKKLDVAIEYIDEDHFSVVGTNLALLKDWRAENKYFFNLSPVTLLSEKFYISSKDVVYSDSGDLFFKFLDPNKTVLFLQDFVLQNNIFQCLQYGQVCMCVVYSRDMDGGYKFAMVSILDDRIIKGFFGDLQSAQTFTLTQEYIVCLQLYNHMLLTGMNDIVLSGYTPLDGSSIMIYKRSKDSFYIVSRYSSFDMIYKKYTFDPFRFVITSDYQGFSTEVNNLDLFGESGNDIMFEGYPYLFCCSKALGGGLRNVCYDYTKDSLENIFCKFNLPDKLTKETKMVFDRHAQTVKTFAQGPLASLKKIDLSFYFANGLPYHFQNIDHSLVLLIREYVDSSVGVNISTRRGNTDDMGVFQSKRVISMLN